MSGILGKKIGMTRVQNDEGRMIPTTIVQCEPNTIAQIKTEDKDGRFAIVLGFGKTAKKTAPFRFMKEFMIDAKEAEAYKKGDQVTLESLAEIKKVTVTGASKGKGTQGVMKRHNFGGGPASHGSHFHREPGSSGMRAKPGRILKGKKMSGKMGTDTVTRKNVEIVYFNMEKKLIGLKGPVPGGNGSLVIIKKS